MDCTQIQNNLLCYCKGELEATEHDNLQSHLDHCQNCLQKLQDMNQHLQLYQDLQSVKVVDHWGQLLQKIGSIDSDKYPKQSKPRLYPIIQYWKWGMTVAIFFLLFTGIWLYNLYSHIPQSSNIHLAIDWRFNSQPRRHQLYITFANFTNQTLVFPMDSKHAILTLYIQCQNQMYTKELFKCDCIYQGKCQQVMLRPGESYALTCDITHWIEDKQDYTLCVDYQTRRCQDPHCTCLDCQHNQNCHPIGGCQCAKGVWAKVCDSQEIVILAQK